MEDISFVHTKESYCMGCNKCIFKCPTGANEAFFEAGAGKVFIKNGFCISCGECISICDHGARDFIDDTKEFYNDLKNGENISVVIAPAAKFNFASLEKIIGYFKSLGVKNVYDVSFGADICTWAHVKVIKERNLTGVIAQPCPVVVSYIEKYRASLINKLSPVQSPVICVATYLKKYLGIKDKIMFLSPCIGKKRECISENTNDMLDYNMSFIKFEEYLKQNNIDLNTFPEEKFDNMEGSLGFAFPRPGGLSENIKYHLGEDTWIKKIEGIHNISNYFDECIEDVKNNKPIPLIIDALNCEHGCNFGTGTHKLARHNEIDYVTNKNISNLKRENSEKLMNYFSETFDVNDFIREYKDRSFHYKKDENVDMEKAFISLGKITKDDREINCFSCGYGNCYDFVYDLATGHNDKNNCRHYLLNKFKKLSLLDDLTGLKNRYSFSLAVKDLTKFHPDIIGIAYVDINGLKQANDIYGHNYGDEMIIDCANSLKKVFLDKVYRIGGDEFIILDDEITESSFNKKLSILTNLIDKNKDLVVSIGYSFSYNSSQFEAKREEADQRMYKAKQKFYEEKRLTDRRNRT